MGTAQKTEMIPIVTSSDVVSVRQRVRIWTTEMKFSLVEQTKIITAASELGRNTFEHGGGGVLELSQVGTISLPITGETACGDAWSAEHVSGRTYIVADGLGHGPAAAEASNEAIRIFHQASGSTLEQRMSEIHAALAKTRGAAISMAEILPERGVLNYMGVGNVVGAICDGGKSRSLISMNGIVGHAMGRLQQFAYPWDAKSSLIMHSDGLNTRWNVDQYPGLAARHPALIAGVLYRDFCRRRDDATILVSRI